MGPEPGKSTQDALEGRPDTPIADTRSPRFSRRTVVATAATFAALAAVGFDLSKSSSAYAAQRFIWPFPLAMVYREFGPRDLQTNTNHLGIDFGKDIANKVGTPVVSAAAGTVVTAQTGHKDFNCWKKIDHGDGLVTRYHMMGTLRGPGVGQRVEQGATIGTVGPAWGTGTGPHLHFQTEVNGIPINPRDFMNRYNNAGNAPPSANSEKDDDDMAYAIIQNQTNGVDSYGWVCIYGGGIKHGWVEVSPANRPHFDVFQRVTNTQAAQGRGQALPLLSVDALAWNVIKDLYYMP